MTQNMAPNAATAATAQMFMLLFSSSCSMAGCDSIAGPMSEA